VAKVLSQHSSASRSRAIRDSAAMSQIFISGLDGVSTQSSVVAGPQAASTAARSAMSTNAVAIPRCGRNSLAR
jgi:hypothetical protein